MEAATPGQVLQLLTGDCSTNLSLTNTAAYTLEGADDGGTALKPTNAAVPIIMSSAGLKFTLHNLTFTGANGTHAAVELQSPAGLAPTFTGDTFKDNKSGSFGGALSIETTGASAPSPVTLSGNTFTGNTGSGGGAAIVTGPTNLSISGNTFTDNAAATTQAGALALLNESSGVAGSVVVDNNSFSGNTSPQIGGAIWGEFNHLSSFEMSGNTFAGNRVTGVSESRRQGGAVFLTTSEDLPFVATQSDNAFVNNVVDATQNTPTPPRPEGGGAEWIEGVIVNSTRDTFVGNRVAVNAGQPPEGGAVGAFASDANGMIPSQPGGFVGSDDLFSGNSIAAGGWGGAIYVGGPPPSCTTSCAPSSVTLHNSTLVGNSVDPGAGSEGGAIWGSPNDQLSIDNSIVFGNTPSPQLFGFGSSGPAFAFSDVCGEAGGPAVPGAPGNVCVDPRLTPAGAETPSSPTLDAGSNAFVPAGLGVDLAGSPRILASRLTCSGPAPAVVDMGAFEFTGPGIAPPCAPTPGPRMRIGRGTLVLRHGRVAVKLTCPATSDLCAGTLTLTTQKAFASTARKRKKRKPLRLGSARFRIKSGKHATVKVKVSRRTLHKLGKQRSVRVVVKAAAHDSAGSKGSAKRKAKLILRKPHRKRKTR